MGCARAGVHSKNKPLEGVELSEVARRTPGLSGGAATLLALLALLDLLSLLVLLALLSTEVQRLTAEELRAQRRSPT